MQSIKKIFAAFTRNEKVLFFIGLGVALVSIILVGWIVVTQTTQVVPAAGGEYKEGMVGQPEYVNPVIAANETDLGLIKMIYSNVPDLAASIQPSSDGKTWTVRLKDGLTWQDGQKLTADDVVFTVQSIQNPDANSPLAPSWQGVSAERVSELEVQFTFIKPYAFFADNLKNLYIIPKHLFADAPPGNWHLSDYNLKPIGSGPYKFSSYDKQSDGVISSYHLEAWNGYSGTKPLVNVFDLYFFPNTPALLASFNAGSVDAMGGIASTDLASIARPYDLFAWHLPNYYAVFFNQSKNLALQDASVRSALSIALDRNALVKDVLGGNGQPEYGPIPPDAPYYVPTPTTSSIDLASSMLTSAGWTLSSSSPFRAKMIQKTSVALVINLTVPQIDFLVKTAQDLQAAWGQVGVQVNIATDTPQNIVSNAVTNRSYESLLFGNVLGPSSDLYAFWDSSQRFYPGLNLAIYSNKTVDSLVEKAELNLDSASRAAQFAQAEQDIVADDPAIFLYSPDYLYVTNRNVQGISPDFIPDQSDRFREIGAWYLNTTRVLK